MYEFNDCGVCLNPEKIEIETGCRIKIAEYEGRYIYGFDLCYVSGGVGSPCSKTANSYAIRQEARDKAFAEAIRHMESQIEWYKRALTGGDSSGYGASLKQCYVVLKALKDNQVEHKQPVQLSLFEW